jgi:hypothetical protein
MIIRRTLRAVAAGAAVAASISVAVVASAFAVYDLLEIWVGKSGSAAIVAGLFALLAALISWSLLRETAQDDEEEEELEDANMALVQKVGDLVKQKPILATVAAVAAGVVAFRNPKLAMGLVTAMMAPKSDPAPQPEPAKSSRWSNPLKKRPKA